MNYRKIDDAIGQLPERIRKIHTFPLRAKEAFVETVRRFAHLQGTVALMSGGHSDCARYDILAIHPWLTLTTTASDVSIQHGETSIAVDADPFDVLRKVLDRYRLSNSETHLPITSGLLGYLAYDLKDRLEEMPRTSVDDLQLPHLYLTAPSVLVVHDRNRGESTVHIPQLGADEASVHERFERFDADIVAPLKTGIRNHTGHDRFVSPFSREEYMAAVDTIRDYITRGHVYQVNMSQRFEVRFHGDPFDTYAMMYEENPAPFFAYINAGDHQILSTSPERFVLMNSGRVETRPIKGTRPRGKTPEEDERLKQALASSPKDDAELSMIVDLMRNDIGKVCRTGSVKVSEHKRIEAYENVYHLVSVVNGELDDEKDAVDLIRAVFPGGSITGCPKIRAMEIIDELEPCRRHIYTGSIGYISFHQTMDLSIAIRTATVKEDKMVFSVGGGIVYDSDPGDEFEETLHKGQTLMHALRSTPKSTASRERTKNTVWLNGAFKPMEAAVVSIQDEGFLYGYGFFETIRVQNGRAVMLDAHIHRFNRAWRFCFSSQPPDITWNDILSLLIEKNNLAERTAAVKILAAAGPPSSKMPYGTLLATARAYRHRLAGTDRSGLRLAVYPHGRHSHLSDHKTMNYMFYKMAGEWAHEQDADEAVVLNADGSVSETNTANIFCSFEDKLVCPFSAHALPGTMESAVRELLTLWGYSVETRSVSVRDLKSARQVFLTNSLMGAVPVIRVDKHRIPDDDGLCRRINQVLFA